MNWWDETEARAFRLRSAASLGQSLWQRMQDAGLQAETAYVAAYDLGQLHGLCADFIKLVEGLLLCADGDSPAVWRQGLALSRWCESAVHWAATSAGPFNQLLDGLQLDPSDLAEREDLQPAAASARPEEQGKVDGRFRNWHLLYERLDLKLASVGMPSELCRGLSRSVARIYEESLITLRAIHSIERANPVRFGRLARTLLDLNTTWHFDLGPYHLGHGRPGLRGPGSHGLQTWLLLAFRGPIPPRGSLP